MHTVPAGGFVFFARRAARLGERSSPHRDLSATRLSEPAMRTGGRGLSGVVEVWLVGSCLRLDLCDHAITCIYEAPRGKSALPATLCKWTTDSVSVMTRFADELVLIRRKLFVCKLYMTWVGLQSTFHEDEWLLSAGLIPVQCPQPIRSKRPPTWLLFHRPQILVQPVQCRFDLFSSRDGVTCVAAHTSA
jgi:hypothetical protein